MKSLPLLPLAFFATLAAQAQTASTKTQAELLAEEEKSVGVSDSIFREYRLAVLFTREELESPRFGNDRNKIKTHLQQLEKYLNSIYVRDAGVKFTMVYNDKLIDTSLKSANVYIDNANTATKLITERIGVDNYDIGVCCNYYGSEDAGGNAGYTSLGCLQWDDLKGNVISSKQEDRTIAHELAHAFGCQHPWVTGSEPGNSGQSIAGYGFSSKTHFLSLASLTQVLQTARTADKIRKATFTKTVSPTNTPPCIDRTKMKREYIIPKNTYFTLPVYATDKEQKELSYACAQWNYVAYDAAWFPTYPSQHSKVLNFGRTYSSANYSLVQNSDSIPVGEYKMLISVSDALPVEEAIEKKQAPLRDNFLTMFKVIEATPFKIKPLPSTTFKTGERFTLRWGVDKTFFDKDSKVRILLSDDGGSTFKHVLVPSTANDGECEVVLPQQVMGKMNTYVITTDDGQVIPIYTMGSAVFRIETEKDDLCFYDITYNKPNGGGTTIDANPIQFNSLPSTNYVKLAKGETIPDAPTLTASKNGVSVPVTYSVTQEDNIIRRLWVAKDGTDEASYVQWIETEKEEAPSLDAFKERYEEALANKQNLLQYTTDANYVTGDGLITDASQITSNAKETKEGSYEGLIDNDRTTYFHSTWSTSNTTGDLHFLQVDLKKAYQQLVLKYSIRRGFYNDGTPKTLHVYGTNTPDDASSWADLGTETCTYALATNETGMLPLSFEQPYRYLKLVVEETVYNKRVNGNLYFYWSELHAYPAYVASKFDLLTDDQRTAYNSVLTQAKAELDAGSVTSATYAALQNVLDNLNEVSDKATLADFSKSSYLTLYSDKSLVVPEGMKAAVVVNSGSSIRNDYRYQSGMIVPAYTGVLLKSGQGNSFYLSEDNTSENSPTDNLLHGTLSDEMTYVEGNNLYYKLAFDQPTHSIIGFYWGATDGSAFTNKAGKAYLALPTTLQAQQLKSFSLRDMDGSEGSITGIDMVKDATSSLINVFDLNGRRIRVRSVSDLKHGVYIINGKKVVK